MRHVGLLILGVSLVLTSGCTNAILGTLLAPESVVAGLGTSLAETGAQTLSGASLEELSNMGSTVAELDNILKEHPDAANAERLQQLRDKLQEQAGANSGPDQRQKMKESPRPRRPSDTPLPVRKGDRLGVNPPGEMAVRRRAAARPDTLPSGSDLRPDPTPVHAMSLRPVRLK